MAIQHVAIADPDIHEPKGVAAATANKVYISDGAGSGAWTTFSRYGELYITSGATAQALTSTAARLDPGTDWDSGVASGITQTPDDGTMTIVESGNYIMTFWASFDTDAVAANTVYTFYYAVDGTPAARSASTSKVTAGVDRVQISATGFGAFTAGQVVSIYAKSSIDSTITVVEAGFNMHKL